MDRKSKCLKIGPIEPHKRRHDVCRLACSNGPMHIPVSSRAVPTYCLVLYVFLSIHLYSAVYSAHQSEALPVRETQGEESSLERTKRGTWLSVNKVDRVEGGCWFQSAEPVMAKARV